MGWETVLYASTVWPLHGSELGMQRLKVFLTGATGTLGRNLLDQVRLHDIEVVAAVRSAGHNLPIHERVRHVPCDFANADAIRRVLTDEQPHWVIHAAVQGVRPPRPSLQELVDFNVNASLRLFEQTMNLADCRFLFVSSGLAYRDQGRRLCESDPLQSQHVYGATKAAADLLLQAAAVQANRPLTIVRPFSFSGPHERPGGLIYSLLDATAKRTPLHLTSGQQVRDYCAVQDVADGILSCLRRKPEKLVEIWNLGSGQATSLRDLLKNLCATLALDVDLKWGEKPLPAGEPTYLVGDCSRAREDLGWQPRRALAESVWELASVSFPSLSLTRPGGFDHARRAA